MSDADDMEKWREANLAPVIGVGKPEPEATLRDKFAMAALTSLLSSPQDINEGTYDFASKLAYRFADAMMKAREVKP